MLVVLTSHPIQYKVPLWRLVQEAASKKCEVWFLTPHAVKPTFDREFGKTFAWDQDLLSGYQHRFLDIQEGWRLDKFRGVKLVNTWEQEFRTHGVTEIWVEGWRFREFWAAIKAAKKLGIRVLMRAETNDLRDRNLLKDVPRRMLLRSLFNKVDHFLYIGSANRRFYRSFGISDDRLSSAPYCVDNDWFAHNASGSRARRAEIRSRWGVNESAFCILSCGKLIDKKRPLDLIKAAAIQHDEVHLLFVGSGQLENEVKELCSVVSPETGEAVPRVKGKPVATMTGFLNQQEIIDAYVAADCLALPSDARETWGLVVNEAMACGLPAISSDRCGCSEDIVTGTGEVFDCGNIGAFSNAITKQISKKVSSADVELRIDSHHMRHTVQSAIAVVG